VCFERERFITSIKVKVEVSLLQAVEAHRVVGRRGSHIFYCLLTDGSEVVNLTHRPPFTPQEDSRYSFLLEAVSTPEPECGWKD
jgi:hypothetical protein